MESFPRQTLRAHGFDPDNVAHTRGTGVLECTSMAFASSKGWLDCCKYIFSQKNGTEQVNRENCLGSTPIKYACTNGHLDVETWLINHGAKNDVRRADKAGLHPVSWSALVGKFDSMRWLLLRGCFEIFDDEHGRSSQVLVQSFIAATGSPSKAQRHRNRLISWASKTLQSRAAFVQCILPAMSAIQPTHNAHNRSSALSTFAGLAGIRILIAEFCGILMGLEHRRVKGFDRLCFQLGPKEHRGIGLSLMAHLGGAGWTRTETYISRVHTNVEH